MQKLPYYEIGMATTDVGKTLILPQSIKKFFIHVSSGNVFIDGIGAIGAYNTMPMLYNFNEGIKKLYIRGVSAQTSLRIIVFETGNPDDDLEFERLDRSSLIVK